MITRRVVAHEVDRWHERWASRHRGIRRVVVTWRTDASGEVRLYMGHLLDGILDRLEVFPDPVDSPTTLFDVYLRGRDEEDLLDGDGENLNPTVTETEVIVPGFTGATSHHDPLLLSEPVWLEVLNAGEDTAGVCAFYVMGLP